MFKRLKGNLFFKNSILYTIGSMIVPMIGFIMLPVYTNYLSTSEYGIMTTVQTLVGMIQIFLALSLNSAVTRFFYDFLHDPGKQKKYISSILTFVLLFSTILSLILILFSNVLGPIIFKSIPLNPYFFYMVGISWASALFTIPMALFRAQEKAGTFVFINILKAILIMSITLYLIIGKGMGAESALIANLMISFVFVLIIYVILFIKLKFSFDIVFIKNSLLLSIPIIPHVASGWIIKSSDRIILEKFIDISEIGLYAVAVQISMVLSLFYDSINSALAPRYNRLKKEKKDTAAKKLLKTFNFIVIIFGLLSIPISMYAIKVFTATEYHSAVLLIPFLIIGHMVKGFYFVPVAKLFYMKKTKAIATSSSIAAIINISVNFVAIPFIGVYGAIISTIIAEIVRFLLIYNASMKLSNI